MRSLPKQRLSRNDTQPAKAEMEEEINMPGMSADQVRLTFFPPFTFIRKADDQ